MLRHIFTALFVVLGAVHGFLDGQWDHDVYTGRHWNDLTRSTTTTNSLVKGPSFLVLYRPKCEKAIIQQENLIEPQMPPQQYITFGKFDTKTTPKHVWYPFDPIDNLTARYQPRDCPEYLYFPDGGNLYNPEKYDKRSGVKVLDWMWSKVARRFTIRNDRSSAIQVDIRGHKPTGFTVEPGQEVGFNSYISFVLLATEQSSGQFVYGTVLDRDTATIVVTRDMEIDEDMERWYRMTRNEVKLKNRQAREWRWALAQIYLTGFKQPVLLPTFTNTGFRIRQIPKTLYEEIADYYRDNLRASEPEELKLEPAINQDDVKTTMVHLDRAMSERIAEVITPMMIDWLNREMHLTRMYGIREFHRGNILRPHVARVGTQVGSAILVVAKNLDGEPDWDFELTLYDGERKSVNMNQGQMIFFESSTLIHGFPTPFKGRDYAVIFIHFTPAKKWSWDIHPDGHWIMRDGDPVECIDQLITPNTFMKSTKGRVRDEL